MPYKSRWSLSAPEVSLPTFIFGTPREPTPCTGKKLLIDAKRPHSHYFTLSTFRHWSQRFAAGLLDFGFQPGDRLMLFSGNSIFTPIVVMGTIMAEGIYNSANPGFTAREIAYQMKDCAPKLVLAAPNCLEKAREAVKIAGIEAVFLFHDISLVDEPLPSDRSNCRHWTELLADSQAGAELDWSKADKAETGRESQTVLLIYSSGTTGLPKGVEISHRQLVSNIIQVESTVCSDKTLERRTLGVLPFYHGLGLVYYCLMSPKIGMQAYLMDRYDLPAMLAHISEFSITELLLVPPILVTMAKHPMVRECNLSSIKKVIAGAAPLGREVTEQFEGLFNGRVRVRQGWGMTEVPAMGLSWDETDQSSSSISVGELLPGIEAKLVRDDGSEVIERGVGAPGELWVRGPNAMKAYWRNPKATAETKTADGWVKTGDIAYIDQANKWFIVDRKKELIKVRGAQVAPAELEALLLEHPLVVDAAVIGLKTSTDDEEPRAYVVRRNDSLQEAEVVEFVQQRVAKQKRLCGGVVFVDEIPKTAAGKILRRQLRDMAAMERNTNNGRAQAKL